MDIDQERPTGSADTRCSAWNTATLIYKKFGSRSYTPAVLDTVLIQDGSTHVFGGRVAVIKETALTEVAGIVYELDCVDYGIDLDAILVAQQYTSQTVKEIIDDFVANFSTGFTDTNTVCDTVSTVSPSTRCQCHRQ